MKKQWLQKFLLIAVLIIPSAAATSFATTAAPANLQIVDSEKVCMVTNMVFPRKQIPITQGGKTYYGCCENCKTNLKTDPKSRYDIDPVTNKKVDKATAVIAARDDFSVIYFENQKNFETYLKTPSPKPTN